MTNPTPSPAGWLDDLLVAHQQLWGSPTTPAIAPGTTALPWTQWTHDVARWQQQAMRQMTVPGSHGQPEVVAPAAPDRRFAGAAWQADPRFLLLSRSYVAQSDQLQQSLQSAPVDERSKAQWSFALRQVVDALSPANFMATNPEVLQTAMDSGGASLLQGMQLFLQDLAQGRITQTDHSAFEVGRNLATSPGSVVFENELMQLIQYAPATTRVHRRALVVIPPFINKFYILDLQAENSLVAFAVSQGHTVFLVSWRNAGPEQGRLQWDDYLELGVLQAIEAALAISGGDRVNTVGFCVGGTLLASGLAVLAARHQDRVASLTLLTTMLDFSDTGEIGLLVDEAAVQGHEARIGQGGLLKGSSLAQVFAALRANDLIWPYVVNGYLKGQAPAAFDLLFWNADDTNLPGPMFCWYLRNTYLENKLRVPGGTLQCKTPVDLGQVMVPAFLYASREDHIVPWKTAYASSQLLGGDCCFVLGASGHIAGVINPPAKNKRNHWIGTVQPDAQAWLEQARSVPGSWWSQWSDWLEPHGGPFIAAPKAPGTRKFPVIEAAPGRYVKAKAQ